MESVEVVRFQHPKKSYVSARAAAAVILSGLVLVLTGCLSENVSGPIVGGTKAVRDVTCEERPPLTAGQSFALCQAINGIVGSSFECQLMKSYLSNQFESGRMKAGTPGAWAESSLYGSDSNNPDSFTVYNFEVPHAYEELPNTVRHEYGHINIGGGNPGNTEEAADTYMLNCRHWDG
jgi:hypothetical protein